MVWFVIFIAVVGYLFYRLDKKFKQKYNDRTELPDWAASPDAPPSDSTSSLVVESSTTAKLQPINSYKKSESFFSVGERSFYGALKDAFADQYSFFAKVRVVDVVSMNSEVKTSQGQHANQKFNSTYFDFIVCDKSSFLILCAIKLNDRAEVQGNNFGDSQFLESVCQNIQLPLINFDAKSSYSTQAVRIKLLPFLSSEEKAQLQTQGNELSENKQDIPEEIKAENDAVKICPQCSSIMIKRKAKSGAQAGKLFWACSTYPTCRNILPVNDN